MWVIPFPFVLGFVYRLYSNHKISFNDMIFYLTFPFCLPLHGLRSFFKKPHQRPRRNEKKYQIVKDMFEEPYRNHKSNNKVLFWETWRLLQRFVISIIAVFSINPLKKTSWLILAIFFITLIYLIFRPYKKNMVVLHWMEIITLLSFFVILTINMSKSY